MGRARALGATLLCLAMAYGAVGCAREVKGKPVPPPDGLAGATLNEQRSKWKALRGRYLSSDANSWSRPEGMSGQLGEALTVFNAIIAVDRACLEQQQEGCLDTFTRSAINTNGNAGYRMVWNRLLCDDLATKAEILLGLREHKAALSVAEDSLRHGQHHPYNQKLRGDALVALGRPADAAEAYGKALEAGAMKNSGYLKLLRALALAGAGQVEAAKPLAVEALERDASLRSAVPGAEQALKQLGL